MTPEEKAFLLKTIPSPVDAQHIEYSMLFSAADEISHPSSRLIALALNSVRRALDIDLQSLCSRLSSPPFYPNIWPGEHYRLLAGLISELSPNKVIEIGTGQGLSALAIKEFLPEAGEIMSFDIYPWDKLPHSLLRDTDFADGRLKHFQADLCEKTTFDSFTPELAKAEVVFIDGAKDNVMEWKLLSNFRSLQFDHQPIFIFDDIRLWNMLQFWRLISMPKLDLTSFGHWSGTGLVEWQV